METRTIITYWQVRVPGRKHYVPAKCCKTYWSTGSITTAYNLCGHDCDYDADYFDDIKPLTMLPDVE